MLNMEPQRQILSSSISSTPSFTSYSSETLSQIAARVIHELTTVDGDDWEPLHDNPNVNDDNDFEFPFVSGNHNSSLVSADVIFSNGQIRPIYPLFDDVVCVPETRITPRRLPLRELMFEEERGESCSSSSEERNVRNEAVEGSYCVWTPPERRKKKKKNDSIGSSSSKRWKLRDLLLRSHSNGKKESLLFMGPTNHSSSIVRNGDAISTLH
ncbi:unnamed protein product [Lupinus luteus]|uniref:Uncharacterized protein n=1 Tax=Lupinus luteus TaxID=3873 RepID=A0AAV1Y820_LUPLU